MTAPTTDDTTIVVVLSAKKRHRIITSITTDKSNPHMTPRKLIKWTIFYIFRLVYEKIIPIYQIKQQQPTVYRRRAQFSKKSTFRNV